MASTYTMVAYGSQGSAVKQLQSELNKRGISWTRTVFSARKRRRRYGTIRKRTG